MPTEVGWRSEEDDGMSVGQEGEIQALLDRHAIQDLIFQYSDAVTRGDYSQIEKVFAPDATWESPLLQMSFESAGAIIEFLRKGSATLAIQTPHSSVIELMESERAKATTTIHEVVLGTNAIADPFGEGGSELNLDQYGVYFDDFAKLDGRWQFTRRLFVPLLARTGTVEGDVVTTRPVLAPPPR